MIQATDEQQANTHKEFAHQSQLTLAFTQKDMEYKTNEVSAKSAALSQARADLDGVKKELGFASEYFDKLNSDCMNSGITHADRAAAREQEIQSSMERVPQTVEVPQVQLIDETGSRHSNGAEDRGRWLQQAPVIRILGRTFIF